MIKFTLRCEKEHEFESWFRSGEDYDRLAGAGEVPCPVCGGTEVSKALMAPAVGRKSGGAAEEGGSADKVRLASTDPREQQLRAAIRELRRKVVEHSDYVGDRFSEEARKIHYKEAEPRGIYGEATAEEAKSLAEEGVEFHPLPSVPEDGN